MAAHSSILAWRILWTEEPGGLQFMGSHRAVSLNPVGDGPILQVRTLEAPRGFEAQGACLRPAHSLEGLDVGFLLPRPSCVTLNQAESSSLRSVPALRFLIWGHLETCKGTDEFGSRGGERPPAGRWVEADPGGRTHRERGEDSRPSHHCHILGQLGKSRCIRWQISSGIPPTPSFPPARPGGLAEGQRPRGWLEGQVCCLWFRTHFTPRAPVAPPGTVRPQYVWLRCQGRRWWTLRGCLHPHHVPLEMLVPDSRKEPGSLSVELTFLLLFLPKGEVGPGQGGMTLRFPAAAPSRPSGLVMRDLGGSVFMRAEKSGGWFCWGRL